MADQAYYVLEIRDAEGQADRHEIHDEVVILGRSQKRAQILVNDAKASGQHAELRFTGGRLTVNDMNSTNGTFVDGRRAQQPFVLPPNGTFRIGDATLRLVAVFGLPEPEPARTVLGGQPPLDESTRALSIDDLEKLRGMGLPPPEPEPRVEATQALDLAAARASMGTPAPRSTFESPRRIDPGEVRQRQSEERFDSVRREAELKPDPRSLDARMKGVSPDRTVAFERADVEIGDYDSSWQPPAEKKEAEAAPDWVSRTAKRSEEVDEEDEAPARRGPTGLVRTLAVVAALYAVGMGTFISIRPGGAGPEIEIPDMGADPLLMAAQVGIATAQAARTMIDSEYRFASLLGGDAYTTVEGHFKDLEGLAAKLADSKKMSQAEQLAAMAELGAKVGAATATAGACISKLEATKYSLWYSFGAAVVTSASIIFGLAGVLGGFAGIGLIAAGALPMVLTQPAPVEPLYFTGIFVLLGIWITILQFKNRK